MIDVKPEFIDKKIETLGHEKLIATLHRAIGRDKLLEALSKEELLSVLSKEDVIKALGEEEILKPLWSKLGAEQFQKLLAEIDRN